MPIHIYSEDKSSRQGMSLCAKSWDLPKQVAALEAWLKKNKRKMKKGPYVADIGFAVRKDAGGGGAVLPPAMMRAMADLGISLFLSEYRL